MAATLTRWITRAADRFPCPPALRFFLFGTPEPLKKQFDSAQEAARQMPADKDPDKASVDYGEIDHSLSLWLAALERFQDLPIAALASRLGYEPRVLSDYFRFHQGKSYRLWLSEQKVVWAKRMLLDPRYDTVLDVALELGFQDDANLHRLFHAATGCTPGRWRATNGHPEMD